MPEKNPMHSLHHVPHDLVGRAIKEPAFRSVVLELRNDKTALNNYLVDEGHAPIGDEAFAAIQGLDPEQVSEALSTLDNLNLAS